MVSAAEAICGLLLREQLVCDSGAIQAIMVMVIFIIVVVAVAIIVSPLVVLMLVRPQLIRSLLPRGKRKQEVKDVQITEEKSRSKYAGLSRM